MPSLTLELSQKTKKKYVFEQIFKHFFNFEPLGQNFVLKSYLYQKLSRKTLGGGGGGLLDSLLYQEGLRERISIWLVHKVCRTRRGITG